jgi:hypothetical protein
MADFNAEGFVAAVERLGLLLTAVRFPDGNVRLYRRRRSGKISADPIDSFDQT